MTKYILNHSEWQEHWNEQLAFITRLCQYFKQDEKEARRIAAALRILFHQTKNSESVYRHLSPILFYSSTGLYTPSNLLSSWELLSMEMNQSGIFFRPCFDNPQRTFLLNFDDWWNEIIFDDHQSKFTRRDIVLFVANQDGGAHVDSQMTESFARLTKYNSLGWIDNNGRQPQTNPAYQSIRAIAQELLISKSLADIPMKQRQKQKGKEFEMRFADKSRRYKWSTTEMTTSPETDKIVAKDTMQRRTLYVQEYADGKKIEYVGL